jgi:hypothetical protein
VVCPIVQSLLGDKQQHEQAAIGDVVSALLDWSAALGNASAHEMLAALTRDGRLVPPDNTAPGAFAVTHFRIAAQLYSSAGSETEARKAMDQADAASQGLSRAEINAAETLAKGWSKTEMTSLPPWLR